jgi:hypothetical protein
VSYIVMALRGRLGNNLWQFASGLGMARALDARLCFDRRRVEDPDLLLPDLIGANYQEATRAELRRVGVTAFRPGPRASLERYVLRRAHRYRRRVFHKSPAQIFLYDGDDAFREELLDLDPPAYVAGYFQDERFMAAVVDEVAAGIRWPEGTAALPEDLGATIAVSFRRGDFNLFSAGLPLDYYDRAMRMIADTVGTPTFVLFGDDPAFVDLFAERAERRGYSVVSALPFGEDPINQLHLLSECDHAILANSSFAWWGAWLGDRRQERGRTVIAPAGWGRLVREPWIALEEVPGTVMTWDLSKPGPAATLS